jgi:peptidyl-prolyl cis-trans isomerase A (cyclophilin A)
MKHQFFASIFVAALSASALAQQSGAPASQQPAQDLPDGPQPTQAVLIQPSGPTVVIDTSMGRITCQFFQKQAPVAVANFIGLAHGSKDFVDPATQKRAHGKHYYDGTQFHRVIPEFMIQGGDPTATGMGDPGYSFNDEFDPNLNFDVPGRLAMANSGPNTNGSQFFVTEGPQPSLDQKYTIFGQCDESSVLVVKTIARVQTNSNDKPLVPVLLNKVTIVPEGQPVPPPPGDAAETSITDPASKVVTSTKTLHRIQDVDPKSAEEHLIEKQPPIYPQNAKVANVAGAVTVSILVTADGTVQIAHATSGPELLRPAAEESVRQWRYKPFLINGQPSPVQTLATVVFELGR